MSEVSGKTNIEIDFGAKALSRETESMKKRFRRLIESAVTEQDLLEIIDNIKTLAKSPDYKALPAATMLLDRLVGPVDRKAIEVEAVIRPREIRVLGNADIASGFPGATGVKFLGDGEAAQEEG